MDFDVARLVFYNADIAAGSEARVRSDGRTYFLDVEGPRVGATYTTPGLVWMVVPKDAQSIGLGRGFEAGHCHACRSGVTAHRRVRWYVTADGVEPAPAAAGQRCRAGSRGQARGHIGDAPVVRQRVPSTELGAAVDQPVL